MNEIKKKWMNQKRNEWDIKEMNETRKEVKKRENKYEWNLKETEWNCKRIMKETKN